MLADIQKLVGDTPRVEELEGLMELWEPLVFVVSVSNLTYLTVVRIAVC